MSAKRLVLIDGSSYLYRAFHALPPLTTSKGVPTGAVHGVINMLQKLIDEHAPERIAVVFDAPGKTFRDELFEQYKSHRPPMPDDLRVQIEPLIAAIEAMGIAVLRVPNVEADDVIGTLAARASAHGIPTLISTTDKDMTQLVVDDAVLITNTMTNTELDERGVQDKFGVRPDQIIDFLTLVGDASDNIPGVTGVGPKTAAKWLSDYGTLDNLIAHSDEIAGKVGERLRAARADLPLFKQLVTIKCDLDLEIGLDSLERRAPDRAKLRELFDRLEMRAALRKLGDEAGAASASPAAAAADRNYTERKVW